MHRSSHAKSCSLVSKAGVHVPPFDAEHIMLILPIDSPTSDPGAPANIHVSPYDAAFPGTLPVMISRPFCRRC